jgi:DNA-binding CsgD family transcriptional regulator
MSLCKTCDKRDSCHSLCPEAETYVNQDWVNLRELTVGLVPEYTNSNIDIEEQELASVINAFQGKPREKQVVMLLEYGLSRSKIAQVLGITRNNLRVIMHRIAKKHYKNS